jgi:hypothetical protein
MKRYPVWLYVVCVIAALAIVNYIAWLTGGATQLRAVELFSVGFLLGMLAMYIAVHVYRWNSDACESRRTSQ